MIETKAIGSMRKLLIERYSDFMNVLSEEGDNVFSAGVETHGDTTYFRVILKK